MKQGRPHLSLKPNRSVPRHSSRILPWRLWRHSADGHLRPVEIAFDRALAWIGVIDGGDAARLVSAYPRAFGLRE